MSYSPSLESSWAEKVPKGLGPVVAFFLGVLVEGAALVDGLSEDSGSSMLTSSLSSSRGLFREDCAVAAAAAAAAAAAVAAVCWRSKSSLAFASAVTWCYLDSIVLWKGLKKKKKEEEKANLELKLVSFKLLVL